MDEFKIPPISTLAGSTISNYFKILKKGHISPKYYFKIAITTIIVIIATPFHFLDYLAYRNKIKAVKFKKPPLFIIGHWRSGTTLLHNMLAKDPASAYVSTYHALFPNNLASKWLFKTFMRINMPDKRPSDNVELNINFPQEDEFAFSNCQPNAYYNFFYFPHNYKKFYDNSVNHKNLSEKEIKKWYKSYDTLIKKPIINTKGERVILKNPVNTARIDKILKLFPDAKFIYIYRNPITVFFSTRRFFQHLFPTLWLHETKSEFIDQMIFDVYNRLMEDYFKHKSLIPKENLIEIKFEEFEQNPVEEIKKMYTHFLEEDFESVKTYFSEYSKTQEKHKMNKYLTDKSTIDLIQKQMKKYIEFYNYHIPENIKISELSDSRERNR